MESLTKHKCAQNNNNRLIIR